MIPPVTRVGRQLDFLEPSLSSWISSSPLVKLGNRGGMTQISLQSIQVHFLYVTKIIWKENTQEIIMAKIPKKRKKEQSGTGVRTVTKTEKQKDIHRKQTENPIKRGF